MKRFIITEEDKRNILGMYGLINEQNSSFKMPTEIYKIISDIESQFSYCINGVVKGATYNGKEHLGDFEEYVKNTIGFDIWNLMDDKTKSQIWGFAYQSDSGANGEKKYRWIGGLAEVLDSSFKRANVVTTARTQSDIDTVINTVKNNKDKLPKIYNDYLKKVKHQYNSITNSETDCNRKNIWGPRPDAIDRMLNGEDHNTVLDDWEKIHIKGDISEPLNINNTSKKETTSTDNNQEKKSGMNFRSDSLSGLVKQINQGEWVDSNTNGFDLSKPVTIDFKEDSYMLSAPGGKDGFFTLKLTLNISKEHNLGEFPSKESLEGQGYKVWDDGTFQLKGEGVRDWALMYKK